MSEQMTMMWEYGFCLWPSEVGATKLPIPLPDDLRDIFRMLQTRIIIYSTERRFREIQEMLFRFGFEMHEMARRPHVLEEVVE